uniref:Ig-like domain-containing protein n=1 Tax=Maylandia zebra TaxID=106582 RepID=A0A3P9C524_9CICH
VQSFESLYINYKENISDYMVTLGCLATGFNPPAVTFSWNKGSTALTDFIQYPAVQKGDVYTGVSQVRVRKQDWNPQQNFQCVVNHAAGNAQADIRPTLFSSSSDEDGTYTASCFAKEFAPKKHGIKWLKNGADVTISCCFMLTGGSPERPSVFMLPPLEQTNKAEVTLTCFVKDFLPKEVFVSWLVDDEEADSSSYAFNTTEPIENNGFYSAYGQLFVSLHEWKNNAVYSCVVYHESVVNTTRAIVRSIGYRTFDKNRIDLNMNINQDSKYLLIGDYLEFHHPGLSGDDNIASVAIVFILLFLITLLLIFGTTVIKVIRN